MFMNIFLSCKMSFVPELTNTINILKGVAIPRYYYLKVLKNILCHFLALLNNGLESFCFQIVFTFWVKNELLFSSTQGINKVLTTF